MKGDLDKVQPDVRVTFEELSGLVKFPPA